MATRRVPHEITLLAFCHHQDGSKSLLDIVETSNRNASRFVRRWVRDPDIAEIGTARPGGDLHLHRSNPS